MTEESLRVVAYAGYQAEQEPRFLVVGSRRIALQIRRRWREPDARCFRVRGEGDDYLLRYALSEHEWTVERM